MESEGAALPYVQTWLAESAREVTNPLDQKISRMESEIDDLLIRYTDVHPEIIAMRRALARLVAQRDAQRDSYVEQQVADPVVVQRSLQESPVYQEMQLRLASAETDLAQQETRVATLRDKIDKFQSAVDEVLQIESEEKQLNRDYGILQGNHQTLLERLEQARLTREVDTSVDTVKFRTLNPPKVPKKPYGPDRMGMSSQIFGGSLVAGLGIAFLLAQLRPVFFDRRQLAEFTGVPVLGSINLVTAPHHRLRQRLGNIAFTIGLIGLVAGYAAVMTVFFLGIDIGSRLPF
jgi:polysaccharide chain length determinant protein (PEP-CTERM system associated)